MTAYHEALKKEMVDFMVLYNRSHPLKTIYIGGGTPSTYPNDLLLDMFDTIKSRFEITNETEITLEVNPGTVKEGQLEHWRDIGINRLSIGVQSLNDRVLHDLNRFQTAEQVYQLIQSASSVIKNLSIDLIVGLPGSSAEEWKNLIQEVVKWPIHHISIYFLTVHEDTPLYFKVKKKVVAVRPDDEMVSLYLWTRDFLADHGIEQYEVSNFARQGYRSHHNGTYWEHKPYKAFGLGACSFDGQQRFQNEKNLMKYIDGINRNESPVVFGEVLTDDQVRMEKIMLGLRRKEGVALDLVFGGVSTEKILVLEDKIAAYQERRLLMCDNNSLMLTPLGLTLENEIATQLV